MWPFDREKWNEKEDIKIINWIPTQSEIPTKEEYISRELEDIRLKLFWKKT